VEQEDGRTGTFRDYLPSFLSVIPIALAACLGLALEPACTTQAGQEHKAEAERVSRLIEALRAANNDSKGPAVEALEQLPCSRADVCELKRICVQAYRQHMAGLADMQTARSRLSGDAAPLSAADAERLTTLLNESTRKLEKARDGTSRCTNMQGQLSRRHAL